MNTSFLMIISAVALTTILIRFLPFLLFKKKTPAIIDYLSSYLPYAIMAMLVVYCLKDTDFTSSGHGIPEMIATAAVAAIHLFKRNVLLSVIFGTLLYMLLVNVVFI